MSLTLTPKGVPTCRVKIVSESGCPDGGADNGTGGATDGAEESRDGKDDGNVLVVQGRHHSELTADYDGSSGHVSEDLCPHDVADACSGLAEVNHEADCENIKGTAKYASVHLSRSV